MTASRVVLLRHGQTDLNATGRIQGSQDIPLNATGRSQAVRAAARLVLLAPKAIVSSPLSRAFATAAALAEATGLGIATDARLAERHYGEWEGLDRTSIRSGWPAQFETWRAGGQPEGVGIETKVAVGRRVAEAIEDHSSGEDGPVVFVAHGAALTCGMLTLLGMDPGAWSGLAGMDNCHWAILASQPGRTPGWQIRSHNLGVSDLT